MKRPYLRYIWLPLVAVCVGASDPRNPDPILSSPAGNPTAVNSLAYASAIGASVASWPAAPSAPIALSPTTAAPATRIAAEVASAVETLSRLDTTLGSAGDAAALLQAVQAHRQRIRMALAAGQADFQKVRCEIRRKKLPQQILHRQAHAQQNLETTVQTALNVLQSVNFSKKELANRTAASHQVRKALAALKSLEFRPTLAGDNTAASTWQRGSQTAAPSALPVDPPRSDITPFVSLATLAPEDLNPTVDVQITPEITAKAAELGGTAQALYEFVRNACEFQPYLGSRKGSVETLRQRAGNDYDLASLLIALLRSSGIQARYAGGIVEMPVDQANSWLGVDNGQAAGSILSSQGLEGQALYQDIPSNVVTVRCRRVWVEVYVQRGHGSPSWVPLDPAFKLHQVQPGIDIPAEMGLNVQAFVDDYFAPADDGIALPRAQTPLELLREQIRAYLAAHYPQQTLQSVRHRLTIRSESLGQLPASLPYTVISRDTQYSEIPADKRYRVRFRLAGGATALLDRTLDLPQIAGQRITIDYVGAEPADQATIDAFGSIWQTPPYLVNLRPVLRVAGQSMAAGFVGIGLGRTCALDIDFLAPVGAGNPVPTVHHSVICGAPQAIGLAVEGTAEGLMVPAPADDTEGTAQLLYDAAMDYLARCHNASMDLGRLMHSVVAADIAEASVGNAVDVTLDGAGNALSFTWTGLRVDAGRNVVSSWPIDRFVTDDPEPGDLLLLAGAEGSAWGHRIFEDSYNQDSVSTLKILELARKNGITIYKRWSEATLPPNGLPAGVQQAIQAAIGAGHAVTFPAGQVTVGSPDTGAWTGAAWIDLDPATGSARYLLSGSLSTGQTVARWQTEAADLFTGNPSITDIDMVIDSPGTDAPDANALFARGDDKVVALAYHLVGHYSDGTSPRIPAEGNYMRVTRWSTAQFDPGYQDLRTWISRWPAWSGLASATRKVGIVGVSIRRSDGGEATAALPVKPDAGPPQQETLKAVVVPADLAGTYLWTGSAGIHVVDPTSQTTAIEAATTAASTGLNDQSLDVTFTPTGSVACATDEPSRMTIYDVDVKAADGTSTAPKYVGANASQTLCAILRPSGISGRFEEWSSGSTRLTLSYPGSGAFGKQTVIVTGGNDPSTAMDAESLKPRFRPDNASQIHEFKAYAMTVIKVDLVMAGVAEAGEESPGAGLALNSDDDNRNGTLDMNETGAVTGENDLIGMQLTLTPALPDGLVGLQIPSGSTRVRLWPSTAKGTPVTLPQSWTLPSPAIPLQLYLEGIATSGTTGDVQLTASYENAGAGVPAGMVSDNLRITVISVKKIPLGGSAALLASEVGKVYVPTRYGGALTLNANCKLYYTDGSDLDPQVASQVLLGSFEASVVAQGNPCIYNVPTGKRGWYYIKALADASGASSQFNENAEADFRPWNGCWWPFRSDSGATLWDVGGPMDKYDHVYGTTARAYEQAHFSTGEDWFGHCWGWSIASMLIIQPEAAAKNGTSFTRDDMEGLYTELCDCDPYIDQSLSATFIPPGPPTSASGEEVDSYCDDLYRILRTCIFEDHVPVQSNMRAVATPPAQAEEVWNSAIYKYLATIREVPGLNDERFVEISMEVHTNSGNSRPPTDSMSDRVETYVYRLEFDAQGQVVTDSARQNWISASHYPPYDLYRLTGSPYAARNASVTKLNVDGLYKP